MMEANKNLQNSKNRQLEMPPKTNIYYWVPSKPPTITVRLCEDENNKVNGIKMSNKSRVDIKSRSTKTLKLLLS